MILKTSMLGQIYEFKDVKDVLAKASEKKSGDELAGVAAESKLQRIAAKDVLGQLTVSDLRENPVVPYEEDSVTRIIQDDIDEKVYSEIKGKTIQEMREWILDHCYYLLVTADLNLAMPDLWRNVSSVALCRWYL